MVNPLRYLVKDRLIWTWWLVRRYLLRSARETEVNHLDCIPFSRNPRDGLSTLHRVLSGSRWWIIHTQMWTNKWMEVERVFLSRTSHAQCIVFKRCLEWTTYFGILLINHRSTPLLFLFEHSCLVFLKASACLFRAHEGEASRYVRKSLCLFFEGDREKAPSIIELFAVRKDVQVLREISLLSRSVDLSRRTMLVLPDEANVQSCR